MAGRESTLSPERGNNQNRKTERQVISQHSAPQMMAVNHTFFSSSLSPSFSSHSTSAASLHATHPTSIPLLFNSTGSQPPEDRSVVSNDTSALVGALILSLVFLLGLPGNIFIIWSILARARKRSITTLLILNLACADGFLVALTVFFVVYLVKQSWVFGNIMCKVLFFLCCSNMYASILLIMLLSLHRLVVVVKPRCGRALADRRTVLHLLVVLWPLVLLLSLPALLFREERMDAGDKEKPRLVCVPNHSPPRHLIGQYTTETVMGFVIPYGVIICSYVCILRRIQQTRFHRRIRSEKLILAIITTFGLFWLPYHVNNMVQVVAQIFPISSPLRSRLDNIGKSCRAVTSALAFISSSANPVLYAFAGKAYMQQEGLSFMARLFELMAVDPGTRKVRKASRDQAALGLKDRETDSSRSPAPSSALSPTTLPALGSIPTTSSLLSDSRQNGT
ncbi:leukotriene B4 receptor 1-like isoform X1 [Anguilla anguilla]|uniref:leukotriene B4 receptor 1-like isoform X1 n=2 Tax=Anguilla anguilla TaxID=7936 RepID=UPI0015AC930B|nr:leukotriene B4 receptor 1-like isoform X1 [Anguilla anguilla]